jgi:lactoylglutathione lyase
MRYLHTMLRVRNLDSAMAFFRDALGLKEVRRMDNDKGRFTLVFLCAPEDETLVKQSRGRGAPLVELT